MAGYRALLLLYQVSNQRLLALDSRVWKKWVPIILGYPLQGSLSIHSELVRMAYKNAPVEFLTTLEKIIEIEDKSGHLFVLRRIEFCWDSRAAKQLFSSIQKYSISSLAGLLDEALAHTSREAKEYARSLLQFSESYVADSEQRAVIAGTALLRHCAADEWNTVWPQIRDNAEYGKKLILSLSSGFDRRSTRFSDQLSEDQLAELYSWLFRHFPFHEDPKPEGVHKVEPRESAAEFRDDILSALQQRGTQAACSAIARLSAELKVSWLNRVLLVAEKLYRAKMWRPTAPADVLALAQHSTGR